MIKYFNSRGIGENETSEKRMVQPQNFDLLNYAKIKVGKNVYNNPILDLDNFTNTYSNNMLARKETILRAIEQNDVDKAREISDFFYLSNGIYSRLCRYLAYLYRYDWLITPYIEDSIAESMETEKNQKKLLQKFYKSVDFMDKFNPKKFLSEVALKVIRYGSYYGYKIWTKDGVTIQELPVRYCRSRYNNYEGLPIIEFNLAFFDDYFRNEVQRQRVLLIFPKEIQKAYKLYKRGLLPPMFQGDTKGWFVLDVECAFKFSIDGSDIPIFLPVIPALIDLDQVQGITKKRIEQQIVKVLIQKLPIDKNGELVFDPDEGAVLHQNAVRMLKDALGLQILTTYGDVDVEDMADASSENTDDLDVAERQVYNAAGISQMMFNTDGNLALEKSILNDEAMIYNLILQFEIFLNSLLKPFNTQPKKISFKVQLLPTTIYNYKEMMKNYKELTQMGYSKMLPAIALGESQRSVLENSKFENNVLKLWQVFIPPITSNVMSGDMLNLATSSTKATSSGNSDGAVGRPEKADDEKSEKTIQNKESMS